MLSEKNNGQAERGLYLPSNASIAEFINKSERDGFILITDLRYKRRKGIKKRNLETFNDYKTRQKQIKTEFNDVKESNIPEVRQKEKPANGKRKA